MYAMLTSGKTPTHPHPQARVTYLSIVYFFFPWHCGGILIANVNYVLSHDMNTILKTVLSIHFKGINEITQYGNAAPLPHRTRCITGKS